MRLAAIMRSMAVCAVAALALGMPVPAAAQGKSTQSRSSGQDIRLTLGGSSSYLGVNVAEVDAERAKQLKLADVHGVEITGIAEDGPAAKAGLKTGDVVLDYQGQRVEGTQQFVRLVQETPIGRAAKMTIMRSGSKQEITAQIGDRSDYQSGVRRLSFPPDVNVVIPDIPRMFTSMRSSVLGVEVESVDGELAAYFGVKRGALVRAVTKASAAAKAGIKAGDVIVKVENETIEDARQLSNAVRAARSKQKASITVMRDRKETTLTVELQQDGPAGMLPRGQTVLHVAPQQL